MGRGGDKTKVYCTSLSNLAPNHGKLFKRPPCYHIYHVTVRHWVTTFGNLSPKKLWLGRGGLVAERWLRNRKVAGATLHSSEDLSFVQAWWTKSVKDQTFCWWCSTEVWRRIAPVYVLSSSSDHGFK
ncbi:hypothetical protein AVEN_91334-1 [Araneus ventricosus]|uniref:Uncharacterized protein n=1 Tax=Araneus ventricosus TaxID=182803 RepID=A0A4Y2LBE5_ARAVE|nr:hypothetical protein AVEN_91334-1 [Araneus ventricosus]